MDPQPQQAEVPHFVSPEHPISLSYLPSADWSCSLTVNVEQYFGLLDILYKLLRRRTLNVNGVQTVHVASKFMELVDPDADLILSSIRELNINRLESISIHPLSLAKLIACILNTNIQNTRANQENYSKVLADDALNVTYIQIFQLPGDRQDDDLKHTIVCFMRLLKRMAEIINYQGGRCRRLFEIVLHSKRLTSDIASAQDSFNDLQMSLTTRSVAYDLIQAAAKTKKKLMNSVNALGAGYSQGSESDLKIVIPNIQRSNALEVDALTQKQDQRPNGLQLWFQSVRSCS